MLQNREASGAMLEGTGLGVHVCVSASIFRLYAPGAVVEAHARAVAASVVPRATKGIPGRTMNMLTQELMFVLEGSDGAAERCAAMESLFWLQVGSFCTILFTAKTRIAIVRTVSIIAITTIILYHTNSWPRQE